MIKRRTHCMEVTFCVMLYRVIIRYYSFLSDPSLFFKSPKKLLMVSPTFSLYVPLFFHLHQIKQINHAPWLSFCISCICAAVTRLIILTANVSIDCCTNDGTNDRCYPEQPQLCNGPTTCVNSNTRTASRIYRRVCYRDTDEMNQGQA